MSLCVIFLGTAGSVPTTKRSLPAILVQRNNEHIMLDCGEGVQRQMVRAKTGFHKKMKILITHMHGDHVLGFPGLLQTMSLLNRERKIDVYGPKGIEQFFRCFRRTVQFGLTFQVGIHEIEKPGIICEEEEYRIKASWANHTIPAFAYSIVEKPRPGRFYPEKAKALRVPESPLWAQLQNGKQVKLSDGRIVKPSQVVGKPRRGRKIVYTGDTRPFKGLTRLASGADLLIHESTLEDELAEKANEDGHSTPSQAAESAKAAKAQKLILTHISARYTNVKRLLEQARKDFKKTEVAEDFMKIELPLLEV
jgi:ribonuclease Z